MVRRWMLGLLALGWAWAVGASQEVLAPEQAFRHSARLIDERTLALRFEIADGYYMYREQFAFTAPAATLGAARLPSGQIKYDTTFQKDVETYRGEVLIELPVQAAPPEGFRLVVRSQGCADQGLCYPPMEHEHEVSLRAFGAAQDRVRLLRIDDRPVGGALGVLSQGWSALWGSGPQAAGSTAATPGPVPAGGSSPAQPARIEAVLASGQWWAVLAVFWVAGLLLSLTPCVLPMLPILSSLIVGQADAASRPVTRGRGLALAASYALGMALVYTALGVAAGWAGEGLAARLQQPEVLALFAALLVGLALSMFGFYELQLPRAWRERLTQASGRTRGGRLGGVFVMGGLSALIVSPCVAAPLAAALVYISQTRDVVLGGAALFALAGGMSVPLLLLGASAGHWLPRAGAWMEHVKHFFGVLLLALALWMLQSVLPGPVSMLLWGALLLVSAVYLRVFDSLPAGARGWARFFKGVGMVLAVLGVLQLVGAASGGSDPWQPLRHWAARVDTPASTGLRFQRVASVEELERIVATAGRPVMLDFYADWCVSCKEMEVWTFKDPRVQSALSAALLLQADVTRNSPQDRALLRRFRLFGPPGIVFFDAQGREVDGARVIGFQSPERFLQSLAAVGLRP
ncbi:MAG: thiol:disulfide interchange protein DsbD [Caldimonas sp.]|nr:MAG: thiol:disulfide interchange protein DsbD [Caldimonas sp.]